MIMSKIIAGMLVFYLLPESNGYEADRVTSLPDFGEIEEDMYSGYVALTESKAIHYIFVKSRNDPASDPLLLWFNGGPGCSSMEGFLSEHGPYNLPDKTGDGRALERSEYSWNQKASVLYVESPAGVGFSTYDCRPSSDDSGDCDFDDSTSADDNLAFLLKWYEEKFPEFKSNPLYLSGESYAGLYVPYLLSRIHEHNAQYLDDENVFKPNLIGMIVLNGVTNWKYDAWWGVMETAHNHFLIDDELYRQLTEQS